MLRLPSSPETLANDRFSLTDIETDGPIPFWPILRQILAAPARSTYELLDALETIAVTLRERRDSDNAFLRQFLDTEWDAQSFLDNTWPRCVEIALEMPQLFPDGYLQPLTSESPTQVLTPRQISCLVVHQFLCTLPKLPWVPINEEENSQDLHIWYAGDQPHPKAVSAYLTALFTFFERVASNTVPSHSISLTLHTAPSTPHIDTELLFKPISTTELETPSVDTSLLGLPSGACVISANSHIGFGRTASQEEMHVGCTPQSLPAKLFAPPLKDNEVIVLRGCEAVVELTGYARNAKLSAIIPVGKHNWSARTMLFMDALELDGYDASASTPDLLPGNVDRELTKAYTAFASYPGHTPYETVVTGHWGCRAFGGNREIKSIIQWSAASMAGVQLNFVCDKSDSFVSDFRSFTSQALSRRWTVHRVIRVLREMRPTDEGRLSAFHTVCSVLNEQ
ncbi:Poly glycohydrolase isoform [Mycena venus]|uniref:poly(ADP-ribose) glycohydrolase n=1 Tax=Mycena venus TaxID=2733690 RepID=A0A8H7DEJ5_9AGAR|nr:Poly glycohydrolase isoform [Mycena venus]